ncbi:MAG TPA: lysoplasmalogenase family protein, partial [Steroidobacteraceae bacterium]|nr:lysoplasmalogenase family protein [Steroidobacteraceae bacterium]
HLGALAIPVVLYIAAIVAMTALSFRVPQLFVPVGAVLFMTSDSLIALGKFLWPMRWLGLVIWMTYAMGQLLITFGLLRRASSSESKQRTLASDLA